jgi:undecaprenyl-phosphate 4-deoxy-4-formamido-L-arabinose transferase
MSEQEALLPGLSVIVPVYNSERSLDELVERLTSVLRPDVPFEIVFVDDGSRDTSWATIERLAVAHDEVVGISLMRNYGQHSALLAGIRSARHEVIVTMDDDLQHRPEDVPSLLASLDSGTDLVYGRSREEEHGLWRNLSSRVIKASMAATVGNEMARQASAFRCFRTILRESFAANSDPYVSIDVLLSWSTTRIATTLVDMDQRKYGASNYTFRKLTRHAINMLTGYSTLPLRLVALVGFTFSLFGFGVLVYVVVTYIVNGGSLPGFPFLASIISIFSGAQLFGLGVLGEYLGRMHFRSMQQPAYSIRQHSRTNARGAESTGSDAC